MLRPVNTSTRAKAGSRSNVASKSRFRSLGNEDDPLVDALHRRGRWRDDHLNRVVEIFPRPGWAMDRGMVAENSRVAAGPGNSFTMRFRAWMKPRSSMRSASSRTEPERSTGRATLVSIRSSRRPGVATRISTPRAQFLPLRPDRDPAELPPPSTVASRRRRHESCRRSGSPALSSDSARGRGRYTAPVVAVRRTGAAGSATQRRRSCRSRSVQCRTNRVR